MAMWLITEPTREPNETTVQWLKRVSDSMPPLLPGEVRNGTVVHDDTCATNTTNRLDDCGCHPKLYLMGSSQ